MFGIPTIVSSRDQKAPDEWWDSYGDETPELKKFAIRILSLTCNSSRCERNWSAFERVYTKKRNRLQQKKMNDLVFIMYNLKLKEKNAQGNQNVEFEDLPSNDEWLVENDVEQSIEDEMEEASSGGQLQNAIDNNSNEGSTSSKNDNVPYFDNDGDCGCGIELDEYSIHDLF
ncbi:hypothetical protein SLE2022_401740 [Rubroshorea leprosula]